MTRLYLVRHGEVATQKICYGQLDVALSEGGVEQLRRVADALASVELEAVYTSDLRRAAIGAQLIAARHDLQPVLDPCFREMSLGSLEGLSWDELHQRHPEMASMRYRDMWTFRFPGGENLQDVAARALPALDRLLERHPQGTVVLVAHNSVTRLILATAISFTPEVVFGFDQDFGCVNRLDFGERIRVGLINWTPDAPL
jgi:alpha-ribazole phosphatase